MAITTNNLISRQTVGSAGAASITFSNIPATFTDLRLVWSGRTDYAGVTNTMNILLNSASTTFTLKTVFGDGTTADTQSSSTNQYVGWIPGSTATASTFGNTELYIPNYTSSNQKSFSVDTVTENNATAVYNGLIAGLWSGTSAISSITLNPRDGNWVQYSTFSLYGISSNTSATASSVPQATGGDVITTDGTYWYHQFLYSGTFTPLKALTADYLIVAGGGGGAGAGGSGGGGGGGAGGMKTSTGLSLTTTAYTCTIGAGGAGGLGQLAPTVGTIGNTSSFNSISTTGGGYGGKQGNAPVSNGGNGGSGGGGGAEFTATNTAGTGVSGEGSAGGTVTTFRGAAGGGGKGSVGTNTSGSTGNLNAPGGNGGTGSASSITGTSLNYAGGGGGGAFWQDDPNPGSAAGGTGGSSVGGNGGTATGTTGNPGAAGSVNRGGGGGGGAVGYPTGSFGAGGLGGSGIVVIKYAV